MKWRRADMVTTHATPEQQRAAHLRDAARRIVAAPRLRVLIGVSPELAPLAYFPERALADLAIALAASPTIELVEDPQQAELALFTAHGSDLSGPIAQFRRISGAAIGLWFWDYHVARDGNLRSAAAADFLLPSHRYCADRVASGRAVLCAHVPACCIQFRASEAGTWLSADAPRDDALLVNYVDYPGTPRSKLFAALRGGMPEARVMLMPANDRRRYFALSEADRFREWTGHKTSLVVALERDLSTRLFDALLAGQVPVIAGPVDDLDRVIEPAERERLGVVCVRGLDVDSVRAGHRDASRRFDAGGAQAIRARHDWVAQGHLLHHRVEAMVAGVRQAAAGVSVREGRLWAAGTEGGLPTLAGGAPRPN
jgi:hypothetical protein